MPLVHINGIELYYEVHGSGPAIVFAHGGGGNHLSWWQQVPEFSRRSRCITFDHRCFGQSRDVPDGPGPTAFVEDLRQLLDYLGVEKATLVGQSMGGWSVLGFAAAYPDRIQALVLCDTTAGMDDPDVIREEEAMRMLANTGLSNVLARAYAADYPTIEPMKCFLYRQISGLNYHVPLDLVAVLTTLRYPADFLVRRSIPTMMLVGEEDSLTPVKIMQIMARRIPHARFVKIAGSGHSLYFEKPEEFNRELREFLASFVATPEY